MCSIWTGSISFGLINIPIEVFSAVRESSLDLDMLDSKDHSGNRIQKIFAGNAEMQPDQHYSAAFVTMQGVPQKYGRSRENQSERIIDAMRKYLSNHRPVRAELRGTFIAV